MSQPIHKPKTNLASPFAGGALPNPFAPKAPQAPRVEAPKAPAEVRYGIAKSGPAVDPNEVETTEQALELVLQWGEEVLHVAHLSPGASFAVGESDERQVDYFLSSDLIGAPFLPIVEGGALVVPAEATGEITVGESRRSLAEARTELAPFSGIEGARLLPFEKGAGVVMSHRGFTFRVRSVAAGKRIGTGGARPSVRGYLWAAVSLGIHALFLTMFYFLPPSASAIGVGDLGTEHRLIQYAMEPPSVMEEEPMEQQPEDADEGTEGQAHADDTGAMGDESSERNNNHYEIRRRNDGPSQLSRDSQRDAAANVATIGALRTAMANWNTPTSPFGALTPNGTGEADAMGALMGDFTGNNFGIGGLGLNGTGRGGCIAGGPCGEGTIGLGHLGTIGSRGHGDGDYGRAANLRDRTHTDRVPRIREVGGDVHGALSADVIRRVVRRHLAEVRYCYEQGLRQNPALEGRVAVQFIISGSGAVQSAAIRSNDLGNAEVGSCIAQTVRRWTFPQPENGGVVGVTYPFSLRSN